VAYIVDQAYDGAEEADEKKMWFDLLNRPTSGAPDSKLKFDTSIGQWTYPSLSAEIDKEEMLRTGDRVPKMPKRTMQLIKDRLRPSFMGGGEADPETHFGESHADVFIFAPPLPESALTPLSSACSCMYHNAEVTGYLNCSYHAILLQTYTACTTDARWIFKT